MAPVTAYASPFNCRYIEAGSEMQVSVWNYALCTRTSDRPRIVSETECARCPWWQEPVNPCRADGPT